MLHLILQIAGARYALEARSVIEVLPLVRVQSLASLANGAAGVIDYHGAAIPLVDLGLRLTGNPTVPRLGTRLVVVSKQETTEEKSRPGALLVERVLGATQLPAPVDENGLIKDAAGFIQLFDLAASLARPVEAPLHHPAPKSCATSKSF